MYMMCDLTQFVISSLVYDPMYEKSAIIYLDNVVLILGMVTVVVAKIDSKFESIFA